MNKGFLNPIVHIAGKSKYQVTSSLAKIASNKYSLP